MELPSLSVVIPNYNHGHFIGRALQSLLAQSVKPQEIIVIDDGSTDDSVAVIGEFVRRDSIIHLLKNERNQGVEASTVRGLSQVSGDYVYLTSSDDQVLPGFVEQSLAVLARHPWAGLVWSDNMTYDADTGIRNANRLHLSETPCYFSSTELVELFRRNHLPCLSGFSSVMTRSALLEPGVYVPALQWYADGFATTVIALRYGACYIPRVLTQSHMSSQSYMRRSTNQRRKRDRVFYHAIELAQSPEYSDIYPLIKKSGILGWFGLPILSRVLLNAKHWDYLTVSFLRRVVWIGAKKGISNISPRFVKAAYYLLRDYYRCNVRKNIKTELMEKTL